MFSPTTGSPAALRRSDGWRDIISALLNLLPWCVTVALTVLNVWRMSRLGINDDAFITFRVARNLASGHGFVFNPGERVQSITTPGYALLLAATSVFSKDFVSLALVLNGIAMLILGVLLIDLTRVPGTAGFFSRNMPAGPPASTNSGYTSVSSNSLVPTLLSSMAAVTAISLTFSNVLFSESVGMETTLYMAALLATFAWYRRALASSPDRRAEDRWLLWTAVGAGTAFLVRPDGALVGLAIGLHWLVTRRRIPWRALAAVAAIGSSWILFAWLYYGSPLPNTLAAKVTQGMDNSSGRWGPQLLVVAELWASTHRVAAGLALIGLFICLWQRRSDRLAILWWMTLYIALHTVLQVRSYYWYYVPLLPAVALLTADGLVWLAGSLIAWIRHNRWARLGSLAVVGVLLVATLYPVRLAVIDMSHPDGRPREVAYQNTSSVLKPLCAQADRYEPVGTTEIGVLGYYSDCSILDFPGLLQPHLAHLRGTAADKIFWAMKSSAPPLTVFAGDGGLPTVITDQDWFKQRYEPIDSQEVVTFRSVVYQRWPGPPTYRDLSEAIWWEGKRISSNPNQTRTSNVLTTTFSFEIGVSPTITMHTYLPPESRLKVAANGQPVADLVGEQEAWLDYRLPPLAASDGQIILSLAGTAADQPAAVAWIESNALPSVHYFGDMRYVSERPWPSITLEPGQSYTVTLAPQHHEPLDLEILHRDQIGTEIAIQVNGDTAGVIGGTDGWQLERLALPIDTDPRVMVVLRNQGQTHARLVYVQLVTADSDPGDSYTR